jgi:hypothetical protein
MLMADYTKTKAINTKTYPVQANGTSGLLTRVEPLLTPAKLKSRYLKGILERLPSGVSYTTEELKDQINMAINEVEMELKVPVFAEQFVERLPFHYNDYKSYIHLRSNAGPIISIEQLAIVSANRENIFEIPSEWIDTANFHQRLINVVPLLAAYGVNSVTGAVGNAGIAFLTVLDGLRWVPAYWQITITAGLAKDAGQVPIIVNNLIGIYAALNILSSIAPNNSNTSVSISQDGIGQSSSNPGPAIFQTRINELQLKKREILKQLQRLMGQKMFVTTI